MTFVVSSDEDEVVPELKLRIEDDHNGDYVKLGGCEPEEQVARGGDSPTSPSGGRSLRRWITWVALIVLLGALAAVAFKWVGPFFMDKEIIPIINWEMMTFSTPVLAVIIFMSIALFPSLLLPSSPSMWLGGMTFGYGFGFLLIIAAVAVGVSLPYFIGSLFSHKIQGWLEKYPKKATVLKSAGEGNWLHQFQAVALIRISPFPYVIYNYCSVATGVKYCPYILGSLVGMVPDIFAAIYTGILICTLADASHDQRTLSTPQVVFNVLGFCATVAATIIFTMLAKRKLKASVNEEEQLLA